MITEDYVSFEIAKLLKEKGFDEYCFAAYSKNIEDFITAGPIKNSDIKENDDRFFVTAPTLQMAMKWLRKIHNIDICICIESDNLGNCFDGYVAIVYKNRIYRVTIRDIESNLTYESACERAIKYCLTNLI